MAIKTRTTTAANKKVGFAKGRAVPVRGGHSKSTGNNNEYTTIRKGTLKRTAH